MSPSGEILVVLLLILLNGFFAAAEIAILTARRGRLEQRAKQGDGAAQIALGLASDATRFLSTVQVGITVVGTLAAAYGGASLVEDLAARLEQAPAGFIVEHRNSIALGLITASIAFGSLVLGELIPKRLALHRAEGLARVVAWPMYFMSLAARPFVSLLGWVTSVGLHLLGVRGDQGPKVSVEDIQHLIATGAEEGLLDVSEQRVAIEALRLGERRVRDVMQPRIDVEALDIDTPADEVIGAIAMAGFSRLPVYEDTLDHILGFVYIKDVFLQQHLGRPIELRRLIHPPLFVPENLALDRLLAMFQAHKTQLAIVVDEYGGTEGLITLEDVLEELVGEIHDEHRRDDAQMIVPRDDSSWLVDGGLSVHDLVKLLCDRMPQLKAPGDVSTVSGLILSGLKRLPKIGETVDWSGVQLEVVDMDGQRIDRVLVALPKPEEKAKDEG